MILSQSHDHLAYPDNGVDTERCSESAYAGGVWRRGAPHFWTAISQFMKGSVFISIFTMLLATLTLTGCRTTGKHINWYQGQPRATNEVSLVKFQRDPLSHRTVLIWKVDGTDIRKRPDLIDSHKIVGMNNTTQLELLPGMHTLELAYVRDNERSVQNIPIKITFEAGHIYDVFMARISNDKDYPEKFHFFSLKYGFGKESFYLAVLVVDEQTGEVVAGERHSKYWFLKNEVIGLGQGVQKGKQTLRDIFRSTETIIYRLEFEVDDPQKDLTVHDIAFKWYNGFRFIPDSSDEQNSLTSEGECFRMRTERLASSLGVGHIRVEALIDGNVVASRKFDIIP